ncbi:hypothetical protein LTR08_000935 [Meristemomyces frigidus]|nr:hypothetical protein LTR08_000935 [Meristemomyces frigidus]
MTPPSPALPPPLQQAHHDHDPLALPAPAVLRDIATKQKARAAEMRARRAQEGQVRRSGSGSGSGGVSGTGEQEQAAAAAAVIQRNYRGYRERRVLGGWGLSGGDRWLEALKEANYNRATLPRARAAPSTSSSPPSTRQRWRRVGLIAQRAGSDDTSDSSSAATTDAAARDRKRVRKAEREAHARTMGLEYFLEMVDHQHRYGSNLRRYHQEWKASATQENYFYWLDYGEGKTLDLEDRPRKRLDTELVRYLSREERQRYLVRIDRQGRFCWAKDDAPITTSALFKDSVDGIVAADDNTPSWRDVTTGSASARPLSPPSSDADSDSDSDSSALSAHGQHASKYTSQDLRGVAKPTHLSVDTLMNHLLRKTTRNHTWIFVADTSFRLYIGIKQPGAFQHSSFLHGARVSAAGLITLKRGQVRKLSPLSGHYAPPLRNFRDFVRGLRDAGADMRRCCISRSYAVIVGVEGYVGARKRVGGLGRGWRDLVDPEGRRRREEGERDGSASAEVERGVVREQERLKRGEGLGGRVRRGLGGGGGGGGGGLK